MATIKGTSKHDYLAGTAGADTMRFAAGDDLLGMGGIDKIFGGAGNDKIYGGAGSDILRGGIGNDVIDGGFGNDTLYGDAGDDTLKGGPGNDTLIAGVGHDKFIGGTGVDMVSYAASTMKVGVFLADGNGDNGAQFDTFAGIENIDGSAFADRIEGNGADNTLRGLGGDDFLKGGGGNDRLEGGDGNDQMTGDAGADAFFGDAGNDWVIYFKETAPVTVNLTTGISGGAAAGDTFNSVETIEGSTFGDTLIGGGSDNVFFGSYGNDTLYGNGGNDTLDGGDGTDLIVGGTGNDHLIPEGYNLAPEADFLFGGADDDLVDYNNAPQGVEVNLTTNTSGGFAAGDTYNGIENVKGSDYADILTPAAGGRAYGEWGDDDIYDSTGGEYLRGGRGIDKLHGSNDGVTDYFILEAGLGQDKIFGFHQNVDLFQLPDQMFGALAHSVDGTLQPGTVVSAATFTKVFAHAQLFHDTDDDLLWYYDGGLGDLIQIATVNSFAGSLTKDDFHVIPGF